MDNENDFLTPEEIDRLLRYPHGRAVKLARAGLLPAIFLPDGEVRFEREAIAAVLRSMTKGRPVASYAAKASGDSAARWRVCLHEAGHAVAALRLLKQTVRALVFDDHCGAAYFNCDESVPQSFDEAMSIAAGPAAEGLAEKYAAPELPPAAPLEVTYPEPAKALRSDLRKSPPDAARIARWCIRGTEDQPQRWVNRHNWLHREAGFFVRDYQQEIVQVATDLFVGGITRLPAEPEKESTAHVE